LKFELPKIYPITDVRLSGISHAEQVKRLIEGGATLIQLRDKHASPREFFESAKAAIEIARLHSVRIIINDRVDIALALNADGVHLGQDDLPLGAARKILGPDAIIGFSTHSIDQAVRAAKSAIDYITLGPIFETGTKENPGPVVGLAGLSAVRKQLIGIPLVAIGGIGSNNLREVFSTAADCVALISAIVGEGDMISVRLKELSNFG
jgi:thiamine-phosphate pyrophosphorylase